MSPVFLALFLHISSKTRSGLCDLVVFRRLNLYLAGRGRPALAGQDLSES
jgi:hypothetical protein